MIIEVGNIVKSFLDKYLIGGAGTNQFIDKLAGVVKIITKTDVDGNNRAIKKTFPVACDLDMSDCIASGRYKDFIPNSNYGCIVYLEEVSNQYIGNSGRKMNWKAQYRLVCWINQKKLGYNECSITSKIITTFINSFPEFPFNQGIYQTVSINILGQDPKNINPFSKYSYDEDKSQYAMYPYDYFSLMVEVNYSIDKSCIVNFIKNPETAC